jgi:hypothetical protein
MQPESLNLKTVTTDPKRLAWGQWCYRRNKDIGEGDIAASYSADRIASAQPLRRSFSWQGSEWVCVSMQQKDGKPAASAYRLVDPSQFNGTAVSYSQKTRDGDGARSDPNGFYHGMHVKHAGRAFVLCGPCISFDSGESAQRSLFD